MIKTTSAIIALLALGACASEMGITQGSEQFGDSVRQNIAAQTVNPQGSTADVTASGARTSKAVQAYNTDKVEKPAGAGTMSVQTGGQTSGQ
jgi:hypothetical protein